jgi:hypothetical protein
MDTALVLHQVRPRRQHQRESYMYNLTEKQAYTAMFNFLDALYSRTNSDDLAGFLVICS